MPGILTIARRILPPAFVLFLFVDLMVNPYIPRLGTVAEGARQEGKLTVDQSRALLARTHKLLAAGKDAEALAPALQLYQAYPENQVYIQTLARIYHRLGRYKEEAEYWKKFMVQAPLPWEACPDIGLAYWKEGERGPAIDALENCLTFDAFDLDTLFALAHAREMTGDTAKAGAIYRKALERHPDNSDCLLGLARVEMRMGRLSEARKLDAEVLKESPKNADALLVAGLVARASGDRNLARRYLLDGAEISPDYADFQIVLGQIEESEGRYREAARRYDRALQLDPGNREAARRRGALGRRLR